MTGDGGRVQLRGQLLLLDLAGRDEVALHLVEAVGNYIAKYELNGRSAPAELSALLDVLRDRGRQGTPNVASGVAGVERLSVSTQEAAALLGVSPRTVERRISAGVLPSTKLGGCRLIPLRALRELAGGEDA